MTSAMPRENFDANASRIFVFDEVYPRRAAQEQAEKKKLGAFGMLAKLNPLNRPKDETVLLVREELRYEPFWHIRAVRSLDYTCQVTYPVPVHNPYAQQVQVQGLSFDVARQKDRARIEMLALERCHRKIPYEAHLDGLGRAVKGEVLRDYIARYKFTEREVVEDPRLVKPQITLQGAIQRAKAELAREAVNATEIGADELLFECTYLYARPVFAFEYRWAPADRTGVIEVDGLTGEVVENGRWFVDKLSQKLTRDRLIDLGAEVASLALPGAGLVVKAVGYATDPTKPTAP